VRRHVLTVEKPGRNEHEGAGALGHRTGLFDALAELQPSTSEQIAAAAGLNERYVREWLGAIVTSRVVTSAAAAASCSRSSRRVIRTAASSASLYTISCMHCMTVSLAQGGEGGGAMWGEKKTREYLQRAGFRSITTKKLAHDVQNNWYVVSK
jgi:hypothetical protein